jgi:hypothetical protein
MNILEKYEKDNGKIVIIIIGMIGGNKTYIADSISKEYNMKKINMLDYLMKDKYETVTVDGIVYEIYDHPNCYNMDKMNEDIDKCEKNVILYGSYLDFDRVTFVKKFVYFISTSFNVIKGEYMKKKHKNDDRMITYINKYYMMNYVNYIEKYKLKNIFYVNNKQTDIEKIIDKICLAIHRDIIKHITIKE